MPATQSRHVLAGLLFLLPVIAYIPAMSAEYIWDDDDYITENPTLKSVEGLRRIWFEPNATPQYYPLVHSTYWLEYQFWELKPFGYHLTNILLHALNAVLVWILLTRLRIPGAWFAAAIFALHPVHVETVAWVTERKNVLSGAFYLGALLAYLRFSPLEDSENSRERYWGYYALSLALFVAALLSKTVTGSLPAAILVLVWWKQGHIGWRRVIPLLPMFALAIVMGAATAYLEKHHVGASGREWDFSLIDRCLIAGRAAWFYPAKLLWPQSLIFIYPRWEIDAGTWWQYLFPTAAVSLLFILWHYRGVVGRGPLAAALYFGGTLFPALGFINIYPMRYYFVADHFQYLASLGLIVLFAGVVATYATRKNLQPIDQTCAVVVLFALGYLSFQQAFIYKNEETLWRDTIAKNPTAALAYNNLGFVYYRRHKVMEATRYYRQALRIDPDYALAHYNLSNALIHNRRLDEAIHHLEEAIRIDPAFSPAYTNLGNVFYQRQRFDEAIRHYEEGLRLDPESTFAHNGLGIALSRKQRFDEAIRHFEEALRIDPEYENARRNIDITNKIRRQHSTDATK